MKLAGKFIAAAIMVCASSAQAATMLITYTGVVGQGGTGYGDIAGVFGTPGNTLVGQGYVASFVLDTNAPYVVSNFLNTSVRSRIDGGTGYSLPPIPNLLGSITINGVTVGNLGRHTSNLQYYANPDDSIIVLSAQATPPGPAISFANVLGGTNRLPSALLTTSFSRVAPSTAGRFEQAGSFGFGATNLELVITSITAEPMMSGAVPEPDSWAMMVIGFGMLGHTMRRRVRQRAQAIALSQTAWGGC